MISLPNLPNNPGCYLFKDSTGKIIYIGKAKDLKKRVSSYFSKIHEDIKTNVLVSKIDSVEFFITDTEVEALILENSLIKKHKPAYNIDLKDSKGYAYIEITAEEYPRLLVARKRDSAEGELFGPFVSGMSRDYILEALRRIFKIRTCKKLPKKECIRSAIGLCSAPCVNKISKADYLESVNSARMVLKGSNHNLVKKLENNMKDASLRLDYERALEYKNQILAVNSLTQRQKMDRQKDYDEDIINYVVEKNRVYLNIFNSKKGLIENKLEFEFDLSNDFLEDFLTQYYSENYIPNEIILPLEVDSTIEEYLRKLKGEKVKIVYPEKGEKKELLELVKRNIEINLFGDYEKIEELQEKLGLNDLPSVIECFDISHLSGTSTVASMVSFKNGKPDKANYRRFKIQTVEGIDDFSSMAEVIRRRYSKLKFEKLQFPNLIVVDGGKGQLSSALKELEKLNLKIPIISLAKREEEVFLPLKSNPIILDKKSKALKLLQNIRDEAHRFAINYNRLLRKKKVREE